MSLTTTRVLSPMKRNAFPFVVPHGELWDGETYVENGTGTVEIEGDDDIVVPLYTPGKFMVGPGTIYPVAMARQTAKRLLSRVAVFDMHVEITPEFDPPSDEDYELTAGFPTEAENERQLRVRYGFGGGGNAHFLLFSGGYGGSPATEILFPFDDVIPGFESAFSFTTPDFTDAGPMLRIGSSYYPKIIVGGYNTSAAILKSGDPEAVRGGEATLAFNASTLTFTVTGTTPGYITPSISYEFTVEPKATAGWWEYGSTYDPDTGLPV